MYFIRNPTTPNNFSPHSPVATESCCFNAMARKCTLKRDRERERDRDREIHRQTDRQTDRQSLYGQGSQRQQHSRYLASVSAVAEFMQSGITDHIVIRVRSISQRTIKSGQPSRQQRRLLQFAVSQLTNSISDSSPCNSVT